MSDETLEPTRRKWSVSALSEETLLDRRTLKKILANTAPAGEGPVYWLSDLVQAMKGTVSETAQRSAAALARQQEADADNAEIKRDESMKRLLDGEMVFAAWEEIVSPAKQKFQALPSKLASSAGLNQKQVEKLEREISDILEELSRQPNYRQKEKEQES